MVGTCEANRAYSLLLDRDMSPELGTSCVVGLISRESLSLLGTFFRVLILEPAFGCIGVCVTDWDREPSIEFDIMM